LILRTISQSHDQGVHQIDLSQEFVRKWRAKQTLWRFLIRNPENLQLLNPMKGTDALGPEIETEIIILDRERGIRTETEVARGMLMLRLGLGENEESMIVINLEISRETILKEE
jgi:hypothetical protein